MQHPQRDAGTPFALHPRKGQRPLHATASMLCRRSNRRARFHVVGPIKYHQHVARLVGVRIWRRKGMGEGREVSRRAGAMRGSAAGYLARD